MPEKVCFGWKDDFSNSCKLSVSLKKTLVSREPDVTKDGPLKTVVSRKLT